MFKLYQVLPLNSLYRLKFLDYTSQFLLKYISNSASLRLPFIAASPPTAGNKNGFHTWQRKHYMRDFRNLTSICCAGKSILLLTE